MVMNCWLLSFGFEATNYDQVHVDAFRRHFCYQLHLNRPKVSNVEIEKVKVEDKEVIGQEDGAVAKGGCNFNNVKRGLNKVSIFDYEKLIIPVNHEDRHWILTQVLLGKN